MRKGRDLVEHIPSCCRTLSRCSLMWVYSLSFCVDSCYRAFKLTIRYDLTGRTKNARCSTRLRGCQQAHKGRDGSIRQGESRRLQESSRGVLWIFGSATTRSEFWFSLCSAFDEAKLTGSHRFRLYRVGNTTPICSSKSSNRTTATPALPLQPIRDR